jgi:hypothetical protein
MRAAASRPPQHLLTRRKGGEVARLEIDAGVCCLAVLPDNRLAAADDLGHLQWLSIIG